MNLAFTFLDNFQRPIYDLNRYPLKFMDHEPSRASRNYQVIPNDSLIAKCSWLSYLRNGIEGDAFAACRGDFGTPTLLASWEPFTKGFACITNVFLLPDPDELLPPCFYALATNGPYSVMANEPDYRNLVVTLFRDRGETLDVCADAEELCRCLLHSMLGAFSF